MNQTEYENHPCHQCKFAKWDHTPLTDIVDHDCHDFMGCKHGYYEPQIDENGDVDCKQLDY